MTPHDVQREIRAVVQSFAVLNTAYVCRARVMMKLSAEDLQIFGVNAQQMQSNKALMVQCNDRIYKLRYKIADKCSLWTALPFSSKHAIACAIKIEYTVILEQVSFVLLDAEEARKCLKHFFGEVSSAIGVLAHLDIRLDNTF